MTSIKPKRIEIECKPLYMEIGSQFEAGSVTAISVVNFNSNHPNYSNHLSIRINQSSLAEVFTGSYWNFELEKETCLDMVRGLNSLLQQEDLSSSNTALGDFCIFCVPEIDLKNSKIRIYSYKSGVIRIELPSRNKFNFTNGGSRFALNLTYSGTLTLIKKVVENVLNLTTNNHEKVEILKLLYENQ